MADNGFMPWDLYQIRAEWDSMAINNVQDSYGQEWVRKASVTHSDDNLNRPTLIAKSLNSLAKRPISSQL